MVLKRDKLSVRARKVGCWWSAIAKTRRGTKSKVRNYFHLSISIDRIQPTEPYL